MLGKDEPASRQQLATSDPPRHGQMRKPIRKMMAAAILVQATSLRAAITIASIASAVCLPILISNPALRARQP
jgi:hypothetical protein